MMNRQESCELRRASLAAQEHLLLSQSAEGTLGAIVEAARQHVLGPAAALREAAYGARRGVKDETLRRQFEQMEAACANNAFAKVELRIARAIVNLAGKFEVDIQSSRPV